MYFIICRGGGRARELLASSMLYPFSDELAVTAGGRLTCAFDDPNEYCSWHNAMTADAKKKSERQDMEGT
ncbi:unnamed protein product [Haemonchus placei]|uniref:Uncharacterized protein n=1 Tax=Haemonchus placei TaxID=6290 RepID=A0A3P7Z637_HAEPC|nr:unnamed protein product [Haemonchus placei]